MAVDLDKQLGRVHLAKMQLILLPPVTDFALTWLLKIGCRHSLRIMHEGDFTSPHLCSSAEVWAGDACTYACRTLHSEMKIRIQSGIYAYLNTVRPFCVINSNKTKSLQPGKQLCEAILKHI